MPELQLFRRRWHLSTGVWSIESTGIEYECSVGYKLRIAVYGMFGLFALSFINESSFTAIGLKGGPLEETKRRPVRTLLYFELMLWLSTIAFTSYATYVVSSPTIPSTCWDNNPCVYSDKLPAVCTGALNKLGERTLTPACQAIVNETDRFSSCFDSWFETGWQWVYAAWPDMDPWNCTVVPGSENTTVDEFYGFLETTVYHGDTEAMHTALYKFTNETASCFGPSGSSKGEIRSYNFQLDNCKSAVTNAERLYLNLFKVPIENDTLPSQAAPWIECLPEHCPDLLAAGDECSDWNVLLKLKPPSNRKDFVIGLVYGSWGIIGVTLIASVVAFNSFPDYDNVEGWEGSLSIISRLCCCTTLMDSAAPSSDATARHEIAQSLKMLFGGIDLDPTDRLLAAYLVSAAQHQRRRRHAMAMLEAVGVIPPRQARSRLRDWVGGGARSRLPLLVPARTLGPDAVAGGVKPLANASFSTAEDSSDDERWREQDTLPMYRHSVLLVVPSVCDKDPEDGDDEHHKRGAGAAGTSRAGWGNWLAAARARLNHLSPWRSGREGRQPAPITASAARHVSFSDTVPLRRLAIRITDRYRPMLTPIGLPRSVMRHVAPRAAAQVYTGGQSLVSREVLLEGQRYVRFAIGAYGLQDIVWTKGRPPKMCMGNVNLLVKCTRCVSSPLGLSRRLRERNHAAILEVTGVAPEDFLYASYVNAQGGALPYTVMADRSTRSIVVSLRGTVSMEDLITDLLSQPVDVGDWLPPWVTEEARRAAGDKGPVHLYAHTGIVASATAVLESLEATGLLRELLVARLAGIVGGEGEPGLAPPGAEPPMARGKEPPVAPSAMDGPAALDRARRVLRACRGWGVVITGHSLGAAVACMLAFQLRDQFPEVRCWAFNPPGGLLSWELSLVARSFCTAVVVGKDVISRLSFNNLKRSVDEMVVALARCRRPKLKVIGDMTWKRRKELHKLAPDTFCELHELADDVLERLERYYKTSYLHSQSQIELYPPGRLLFLRPFKGARVRQTWDAVWIDAAALMGEGILIAPSMMAHHRTFMVTDAFEAALQPFLDASVRGVEPTTSSFGAMPSSPLASEPQSEGSRRRR